jgi:hypothetical protein
MMNKKTIAEATAEFLAQGGKVTRIADAEKGGKEIDYWLRYCDCGCNGNRTDHSMRQGEGQFADQGSSMPRGREIYRT